MQRVYLYAMFPCPRLLRLVELLLVEGYMILTWALWILHRGRVQHVGSCTLVARATVGELTFLYR